MVRVILGLLSLVSSGLLLGQTGPFDVLITGARVIDGSGGSWYYADVGIRGDTIVAVGPLAGAGAAIRIDGRGLVAAPGFIDIHSHGRRGIFAVPTAENYLREGVTTIVEGPDGSSPVPLAPFLEKVRQTRPSPSTSPPWWGKGAYASWSSGWPTGKPRPGKSKR
jgi:hypothetical protein